MIIIHSHTQLDFDGFASMLAVQKLYPSANMVLPEKQKPELKQFLGLHRDSFQLYSPREFDWSLVTTIILVDTTNIKRTEIPTKKLSDNVSFILYDHHPPTPFPYPVQQDTITQIGATVTILLEKIIEQNIPISAFEATIFGLGLYSDTGAFTYDLTTGRDLEAAAYLFHHGLDLSIINQFVSQSFTDMEQELFETLLHSSHKEEIDGISYFIATHEQQDYTNNLSFLTRKILDTIEVDAVFSVVKMGKHVYVVGRSDSEQVDIRSVMIPLGGNGHEKAASATLKNTDLQQATTILENELSAMLKPSITAKQMMSSPVKSILETKTIDFAGQEMQKFGHSGLPVLNDQEKLVGVISRRDADKALRHQLGHAPVKAYMTTSLVTIEEDYPLTIIQDLMMQNNIGRLPVVSNGKLVGIVSRSDVIEVLYNHTYREQLQKKAEIEHIDNMTSYLQKALPDEVYDFLQIIAKEADHRHIHAYLIGGIVRDLLLERANEDIDIVIEGDAITFSEHIATLMNGEIQSYPSFGTATLTLTNGHKIDFVSSRTEYYHEPASLPTVTYSHIREDLARRDFTINAMAIKLNEYDFGKVLDFFQGRQDLAKGKVRVLHTLSFIEDPTRIFRAVRFAHRFQYKLAKQTLELAQNAQFSLTKLSKSRIKNELTLMTKEQNWLSMLTHLEEMNVWFNIFGVNPTQEGWSLLKHLEHKEERDVLLLLTALYFFNEDVFSQLEQFAFSQEEKKFIQDLKVLKESETDVDSVVNLHLFARFIPIKTMQFFAMASQKPLFKEYIQKRSHLSVLLKGADLLELGFNPSPLFSEMLLELELQQLAQTVTTKAEAIKWLQKHYQIK
ncbi:CBS domain-containing protein [Alkalihalobacillus pseudalcaliphilus]|uniref:CBS domain-containing protein n=1 Tax=Alkalihalobacillus pseudalcaliphilus TaxID=79884 RepID=UPI00069E6D3A|nr:CBS domain-containing protein [Alkalihalobacillus pseudalcaliphilus]